MASGIEAAELLPLVTMSRATAVCAGRPSWSTTWSVMSMLAWCGMKASRSSTVTPARSSIFLAAGTSSLVAQRKTFQPDMVMAGRASGRRPVPSCQGAVMRRAALRVPSARQTTGPIPGSCEGPTTTAPAPSAKRKAVSPSSWSRMSVIRSAPMTSTWSARPIRTWSPASARAWQKPAQAAETSKAAARSAPSRRATSTATAGICSMEVMVATMTVSIRSAETPAAASAFSAAAVAMAGRVSSGPA